MNLSKTKSGEKAWLHFCSLNEDINKQQCISLQKRKTTREALSLIPNLPNFFNIEDKIYIQSKNDVKNYDKLITKFFDFKIKNNSAKSYINNPNKIKPIQNSILKKYKSGKSKTGFKNILGLIQEFEDATKINDESKAMITINKIFVLFPTII